VITSVVITSMARIESLQPFFLIEHKTLASSDSADQSNGAPRSGSV
jgi:hypothetical protein